MFTFAPLALFNRMLRAILRAAALQYGTTYHKSRCARPNGSIMFPLTLEE